MGNDLFRARVGICAPLEIRRQFLDRREQVVGVRVTDRLGDIALVLDRAFLL
jgi:hypothetical protein